MNPVIRENPKASSGGEDFEVDCMYPAYRAVAEMGDERRAVKYMLCALEAKRIHAALYEEAKAGRDMEHAEFSIRPACGHTAVG